MNQTTYIIIGVVILYLMTKKHADTATPVLPDGTAPVPVDTMQKRTDITGWYLYNTASRGMTASNDERTRFTTMVLNITPGEVEILNEYIFSYLNRGLAPVPNSAFATAVNTLLGNFGLTL